MVVIPSDAEESRCEKCEVTLRDFSNPLLLGQIERKGVLGGVEEQRWQLKKQNKLTVQVSPA
jgi:hypothetical protein